VALYAFVFVFIIYWKKKRNFKNKRVELDDLELETVEGVIIKEKIGEGNSIIFQIYLTFSLRKFWGSI
jgi:hypothetical protein